MEIQRRHPHSLVAHLVHAKMQGDSFKHCQNEGTVKEECSHSNKWTISNDQLQGHTIDEAEHTWSALWHFYQNWEVPQVSLTSSSWNQMSNPLSHESRYAPIHLQEAFHQEIWNLEQLGILKPVKEVNE